MSKDGAIGIFDSGVGGLTILQCIAESLPREDLIYLGDTARYPYGSKSPEVVTRYSLENTDAQYLSSLKYSGIDILILGCTHYPLLKQSIGKFLGEGVKLVDSAQETAKEVRTTLIRYDLARRKGVGTASFFVTDLPDRFIKVGARFLGNRVESAVRIER
jgi:glutamate racemase